MIHCLSRECMFRGLVTSREITSLDYHWFGRSVACPGDDCPACAYGRPKRYYYFSAVFNKQHQVVEACSSFYHLMSGFGIEPSGDGYRGAIIRAERSSTRRPWRVVEEARMIDRCPPIEPFMVVEQVAKMYLLPDLGVEGKEEPREWLDRCAATQKELLRRCVV